MHINLPTEQRESDFKQKGIQILKRNLVCLNFLFSYCYQEKKKVLPYRSLTLYTHGNKK